MAAAVKNRQRSVKISSGAVVRLVDVAVLAVARRQLGPLAVFSYEISVVFVNDRAMRELNRTWRGKDKTTDVLSFLMEEDVWSCTGLTGDVPPLELGDIVISIPQAIRQACEYDVSLSDEVARLLVHGVLHLLGYDHERSAADDRSMRSLEAAILRKIGKEPLCLN